MKIKKMICYRATIERNLLAGNNQYKLKLLKHEKRKTKVERLES